MNTERFIELLIKKESGSISFLEERELEFLCAEKYSHDFVANELNKLPPDSLQLNKLNSSSIQTNWETLESSLKNDVSQLPGRPKKTLIRFNTFLKYAAAAIVLFALALPIFRKEKEQTPQKEQVETNGSISKITLADGTVVQLNADSKLNFDETYTPSNRVVSLLGEGFFNVKHDPLHPFIIHTNKGDIKVTGTSFNLRNYPHEKVLEATLITGQIEVILKDQPEKKIILRPYQKITISGENANDDIRSAKTLSNVELSNVQQKDSLVAESSWLSGKMIFINKSLEDIARQLETQFDTTIVIKNDDVKKYRYTGTFENSEIDYILKVFQFSKKFSYKSENNKIIIDAYDE